MASCGRHHIEEVRWKRLPIGMVQVQAIEGDRQDIAGASLWKSVFGAHLRVSSGNRAFRQWSNSRGPADRVWGESEANMSWCVVLASEIFEAKGGPGRVGGAFELRFAESPALGVTVYLLF